MAWWQSVLAAADKPTLWWVRSLSVAGFQNDTLQLLAQPGQRYLINFINEARQAQLANLVEQVVARRVRISITMAVPLDDAPPTQGHTPAPTNRQKAMQLPLVRHVMEVFEGATIVDVRSEYNATEPPPPAAATPATGSPAEEPLFTIDDEPASEPESDGDDV